MGLIEVFLTSLALSVDAFVCSIITGKRNLSGMARWRTGFIIALAFGVFQFLMPVIGFFAGFKIQEHFSAYDHWVAFALLAAVAVNMLKEVFKKDDDEEDKCACACEDESSNKKERLFNISLVTLLAMAIGTSIDALAVGVSYGMIQDTIVGTATIIGVICFISSFIGFALGQALSHFKRLDPILSCLGAVVLVGIAVKILHEHGALSFIA